MIWDKLLIYLPNIRLVVITGKDSDSNIKKHLQNVEVYGVLFEVLSARRLKSVISGAGLLLSKEEINMGFMTNMQQLNDDQLNRSITENGAIGYKTTGKALLDLNFSVSSLRNLPDDQVIEKFMTAFDEDPELTVKWLFFARDVRQGMGERRLFRICFKHLCESEITDRDHYMKLISAIPMYGRFDDLFILLGTNLQYMMFDLIQLQLQEDCDAYNENKPISLLAKWMPSINSSSAESRKIALKFVKKLGFINARAYRKMLSKLREHIDVVERKMSANEWSEIDYEHVPSKANLLYANAFARNDAERRSEYLSKLEKGEVKINSSTAYPYEIFYKARTKSVDNATLEGMWNALPNMIPDGSSTIVVADGSGSMYTSISGTTNAQAIDVSMGLALYFAEKLSGEFHNKFITFSTNPRIVNIDTISTLGRGKLPFDYKAARMMSYNEVSDTNIEAVFALILQTAVQFNMLQEDIPQNILILSDMEFNYCAENADEMVFTNITNLYSRHGYKVPRLIFWNICSRTGTIPVKENELGVCLVSGFSVNVASMVMSNEVDPYKALVNKLMSDRYESITLQ